MKKNKYLISIIFISLMVSLLCCSKEEDIYMWVAADRPLAYDEHGIERPYYKYKLNISDNWSYLTPLIEGFNDYEEGYEYLLLVRIIKVKNPAMDQYPLRYIFRKVISKELTSKNHVMARIF
jgi:hypothetical protein